MTNAMMQSQKDIRLMQRYASQYAAENKEAKLPPEAMGEISAVIMKVIAAYKAKNLIEGISAAAELVKLAIKYGPIVWNIFKKYRALILNRMRRKGENIQANGGSVPTMKEVLANGEVAYKGKKGEIQDKLAHTPKDNQRLMGKMRAGKVNSAA